MSTARSFIDVSDNVWEYAEFELSAKIIRVSCWPVSTYTK
jgi:hypothetical protein